MLHVCVSCTLSINLYIMSKVPDYSTSTWVLSRMVGVTIDCNLTIRNVYPLMNAWGRMVDGIPTVCECVGMVDCTLSYNSEWHY